MDQIWFAGFLCRGGLCANQITGFLCLCVDPEREEFNHFWMAHKKMMFAGVVLGLPVFFSQKFYSIIRSWFQDRTALRFVIFHFFALFVCCCASFLLGTSVVQTSFLKCLAFWKAFLLPAVSFLSWLLCLSITWNGTEISFATLEWGIPVFVKFIFVHFIVTPYIFLIVLWTWLQLGAGAGMVGVCLARLAAAKVHLHLQQFSFLVLLMIIYS